MHLDKHYIVIHGKSLYLDLSKRSTIWNKETSSILIYEHANCLMDKSCTSFQVEGRVAPK
jgi:hypothetical protein